MNRYVPFVDLARQYSSYEKEISQALKATCASGNYVMGPNLEKFETELAKTCHTKYAVAVANGTDALILALRVLGIGEGDEVITAPNSFIASVGAIDAVGATCVFADVQDDRNICPNEIKNKITVKTKAVIGVHLTGRPCLVDEIKKICEANSLFFVEDAAQAIGAEVNGQRVGSFGDIACFSLHPLKNLFVMGDGGFVTLNCSYLYKKIKQIQNHGLIDRDTCVEFGVNSRLDEIHCATGLVKLRHFTEIRARFLEIASLYRKALKNVVGVPTDRSGDLSVYHNFVVDCDRRDELKAFLEKAGVQTKVHYPKLLHLQPAAKKFGYSFGDFPNAERLNSRQLSLPIFPELTSHEIDFVINKVKEFYDQ